MQPGVFSLAGWDLVGALPLSNKQVEHLLGDDDFRWINRGAIDMMGYHPQAKESSWGLPKALTLYGSLPQQSMDPDSFVSQLKRMLKVRKKYDIHLARAVNVPNVENQGVFLLVMKLPNDDQMAITAINFGRSAVVETVDLSQVTGMDGKRLVGRRVSNVTNPKMIERVISSDRSLLIELDKLQAKMLIIQ